MSDLERYLEFAKAHPALFVNPPGAVFTIILDEAGIHAVEAEMARGLEARKLPAEWASVGIAYQDQYLFLLRDAVRFPDGSVGTYIRFVHTEDSVPGVVILPVYQGQVVLVRHFRHATRTWHLELPRGFGESNLSSEDNARRELAEEISGVVTRLISLGKLYPDAGASTACDELFYADLAAYGKPETYEAIAQVISVSVPELERLIRDDHITDGFTLAAYVRAKVRGLL